MRVFVVSHDAGSAEILSSWVRQHPEHKYSFLLMGPAKAIFLKKLSNIESVVKSDLLAFVEWSDLVVTGSSESSDIEKQAIQLAQETRTKSVTFLDYWYGYKQRFETNGALHFPDEVWVGDQYAFDLAQRELPGAEILLTKNPYIEDLLEEKSRLEKFSEAHVGTLRIVYLCQPYTQNTYSNSDASNEVTDIAALKYCFGLLAGIRRVKVEVCVRLHPLEASDKYNEVISLFSDQMVIQLSNGRNLAYDLVWADVAVGMHAQALSVAVEFDRRVFHCIPRGGKPCVLPHKEIRDFNELIRSIL